MSLPLLLGLLAAPWFAPQFTQRPDGLLVVSEVTPSAAAALRVVVLGGALAEPADQRGVATLLARLVTTGTATEGGTTLARRLGQLGATLSLAVTMDATVLSLDVPAQNFDEACQELLRGLAAPVLIRDELTLEAKRLGNTALIAEPMSAESALIAQLHPAFETAGLFGTASSRAGLGVPMLLSFYRQHYRPDRMMLIATGGIDPDALEHDLDEAWLMAPRLAGAAPELSVLSSPKLPAVLSAHAPRRGALIGNLGCASNAAQCTVLGELALERVLDRLHKKIDPGAQVSGGFRELGGQGYLLIWIEAGRLALASEAASAIMLGLASKPNPLEIRRALAGLQGRAAWRRSSPARLANAYADQLIAGRRSKQALAAFEADAKASNAESLGAAAQSINAAHQFTVDLGP